MADEPERPQAECARVTHPCWEARGEGGSERTTDGTGDASLKTERKEVASLPSLPPPGQRETASASQALDHSNGT